MTNKMFSVAIITYNQEKYISQTLDSILNQEHDYSYEIVIGEDCSTDNTKKVIEEYVQKYPQIIKPLYNAKNKGIINNYYNVIEHCSGKYIMECAGDDYWLPGKVKKQIEFMEANQDVGMCYGKAKILDMSVNKMQKKLFGAKTDTLKSLLVDNKIPALSVCMQKKVLDEYIKEIEPTKKNWKMEDYPEWLWISEKSKIVFFNDIFGVYRNGQDSASLGKDFEKRMAFAKSYYDIKVFFATYFNKEIPLWDENEILFNFCYEDLCVKFSNEIKNKLAYYYKLIVKKNLKYKLIYWASFSKNTFNLFLAIKDYIKSK